MLEWKIELLTQLVDPEREPFAFLCLEYGITKDQRRQISDLMNKTQSRIRSGEALSHAEFEHQVYEIFPSRFGDYHFAEAIVSTLNSSDRWRDVYEHMKKNGMNLS